MNYWVQFWLVIISLMVGLSAFGFLIMSFLFPDATLFDVGTAERLTVTMLAAASFSVIIWSGLSSDGVVQESRARERR